MGRGHFGKIGSESAASRADGEDDLTAKYIVRHGGGVDYNITVNNSVGTAASSAQISASKSGTSISISLVVTASMSAGSYGVNNGSTIDVGIGTGCYCGGKAPTPPVASFTLTKPAAYSVTGSYANDTGGVKNYVYAAIYTSAGALLATFVTPDPTGQSPASGTMSGTGVLPAGSYTYSALYALSNYIGDGASDAFAPSGNGSITFTLSPASAP